MKHSKPQSAGRKPDSKMARRLRAMGVHKDFPLFPHQAGYWAKKVRGKLHYFGKLADDPKGKAALDLWNEQKDALLAGRTPRAKGDDVTVKLLVDSFLTHKEQLRDSGELAPRTFDRYFATGKMLADAFGRSTPVDSLVADDFQKLRADMAKRWGPVALGNEIQMVRSIFRFKRESRAIIEDPEVKAVFRKPSAKTLRLEDAKKGERMFSTGQIEGLLAEASPNMAAMVLLGANCGFGNSDCAHLPIRAIDLDAGVIVYPRPKTGIVRRIPLWLETVDAIRKVLAERPEPIDKEHTGLLFVRPDGSTYVGDKSLIDKVTREFRTLMARAKVDGRCFYDLRRTFQTIGEGAHDLVAVQSIMGHAPASSDMSSVYRQRVDDSRLLAVTNHVRTWLYGPHTVAPKKNS